MTDWKKFAVSAAVVFAVFLLRGPASADPPVGSFTKVEGSVDVLRSGDRKPLRVGAGDPVFMGDAVRTKRFGKAEIQFNDESIVQLAPETRIMIDEYTFRPDRSRERGFLSLFRGKVRAIVSKVKSAALRVRSTDSGFNIKTPTAVAGVKGTDLILYHRRGVSGIIFLDGSGFAYNRFKPKRVVTIGKGYASFVTDRNAPPSDPRRVSDGFISGITRNLNVGEGREGDRPDGAGSEGQDGTGRPLRVNISDSHTALDMLSSFSPDIFERKPDWTKPRPDIMKPPTAPTPPEQQPRLLPTRVNVTVPLP